MKSQQPHTLPEGWEMKPFGEIVEKSQYGLSVPTTEDGETPMFKMNNFIYGKMSPNGVDRVNLEFEELKKYRLNDGDILFNRTNSAELVGKTGIFDLPGEYTFASYLIRFVINKNYAVPQYINFFFNWNRSQSFFKELATKGVSQSNINPTSLQKFFFVLLPTLSEQRRIAAVLGTWDQAIEQTAELLKTLRIRHRGLMQRLLTGKVRLPGFEEDWEHVELGDLFERVNRRNAEGNTNVLTISAQQGLVSQGRYFNKNIASEVVTNYFLLHRGEFAYNKSYSAGYPMGVLKRLEQYEKGIVSPLYICFRLRNEVENDSSFFVHFFEAGCLNRNIGEIAQEGARNHGLLNVGVGDFFGVRLIIPLTIDEQRAISQVLDASLREVRQYEAKLDALREQKRGLMQCLLTGRVRVPGSVLVQEAI